jgi:hypothetical protein
MKTEKERASLFSSFSIFTMIQSKRLRELMHAEHTEKNCMQILIRKLHEKVRDRHTEVILILRNQVVII